VSNYKIGDKVWVECEVAMVHNHQSLYIDIRHDGAVFEAKASDCRPVEPEVVEACTKTANDQLRQSLMDYPFGEPSNSPKILDSSSDPLAPSPCMDGVDADQFVEGIMEARGRTSDPLQVGDAVRFVSPRHERHGTEGVVSSKVDLVSSGCNYWFEANCGQFSCYCTASQLERIDQADPINPSHYKHLPAEAIDIIMAAIAGAPSNQYAFLQGQVIKYLLRCWSKKGIEDLRKAKWYLDRLVSGFDDLLAEASGANDGPTVKRYREPKLSDLAKGPIACECRGGQLHEWQPQILLDILREAGYPYRASCPKNQHKITRWSQCRIEVGE
jgi:hypothetical protein